MAFQTNSPKLGEIYSFQPGPTIGCEIQKIRPALILQNCDSPFTYIIAPLTSKVHKNSATTVFIKVNEGGLNKNSLVLLEQMRSIDKQRLLKRLGNVTPQTMKRVEMALKRTFSWVSWE